MITSNMYYLISTLKKNTYTCVVQKVLSLIKVLRNMSHSPTICCGNKLPVGINSIFSCFGRSSSVLPQ